MVEQVLEFAGASSGQHLERADTIDFGALVEQALQTYAADLREGAFVVEKGVESGLPAVHGDAVALGRALKNLVGNALKHASAGRWVGIRASASGSRTEVLLTVEDRGKGIAAEELPHVFAPFFRGRCAVAAQVSGFGLGLALVSRVAESHGGRVGVVSAPGRGSAFTLYLPAVPSGAADSSQPETRDGVPHPAG
jgi:signal transduction histidine kinase